MEVQVLGSFEGPIVQDRFPHPALPGLRITVAMQTTKNGPQPVVVVNTEDFGELNDGKTNIGGEPVMAVYLNDATLYDRGPEKRYDERLPDLRGRVKLIEDEESGRVVQVEVYGEKLDGTSAWQLIHVTGEVETDQTEAPGCYRCGTRDVGRFDNPDSALCRDCKPEAQDGTTAYETTMVVTHYAPSDDEARQLGNELGDDLIQRPQVIGVDVCGDAYKRAARLTDELS